MEDKLRTSLRRISVNNFVAEFESPSHSHQLFAIINERRACLGKKRLWPIWWWALLTDKWLAFIQKHWASNIEPEEWMPNHRNARFYIPPEEFDTVFQAIQNPELGLYETSVFRELREEFTTTHQNQKHVIMTEKQFDDWFVDDIYLESFSYHDTASYDGNGTQFVWHLHKVQTTDEFMNILISDDQVILIDQDILSKDSPNFKILNSIPEIYNRNLSRSH